MNPRLGLFIILSFFVGSCAPAAIASYTPFTEVETDSSSQLERVDCHGDVLDALTKKNDGEGTVRSESPYEEVDLASLESDEDGDIAMARPESPAAMVMGFPTASPAPYELKMVSLHADSLYEMQRYLIHTHLNFMKRGRGELKDIFFSSSHYGKGFFNNSATEALELVIEVDNIFDNPSTLAEYISFCGFDQMTADKKVEASLHGNSVIVRASTSAPTKAFEACGHSTLSRLFRTRTSYECSLTADRKSVV